LHARYNPSDGGEDYAASEEWYPDYGADCEADESEERCGAPNRQQDPGDPRISDVLEILKHPLCALPVGVRQRSILFHHPPNIPDAVLTVRLVAAAGTDVSLQSGEGWHAIVLKK
jgi:hypothetical protein